MKWIYKKEVPSSFIDSNLFELLHLDLHEY
jgi:hypothetical protein